MLRDTLPIPASFALFLFGCVSGVIAVYHESVMGMSDLQMQNSFFHEAGHQTPAEQSAMASAGYRRGAIGNEFPWGLNGGLYHGHQDP